MQEELSASDWIGESGPSHAESTKALTEYVRKVVDTFGAPIDRWADGLPEWVQRQQPYFGYLEALLHHIDDSDSPEDTVEAYDRVFCHEPSSIPSTVRITQTYLPELLPTEKAFETIEDFIGGSSPKRLMFIVGQRGSGKSSAIHRTLAKLRMENGTRIKRAYFTANIGSYNQRHLGNAAETEWMPLRTFVELHSFWVILQKSKRDPFFAKWFSLDDDYRCPFDGVVRSMSRSASDRWQLLKDSVSRIKRATPKPHSVRFHEVLRPHWERDPKQFQIDIQELFTEAHIHITEKTEGCIGSLLVVDGLDNYSPAQSKNFYDKLLAQVATEYCSAQKPSDFSKVIVVSRDATLQRLLQMPVTGAGSAALRLRAAPPQIRVLTDRKINVADEPTSKYHYKLRSSYSAEDSARSFEKAKGAVRAVWSELLDPAKAREWKNLLSETVPYLSAAAPGIEGFYERGELSPGDLLLAALFNNNVRSFNRNLVSTTAYVLSLREQIGKTYQDISHFLDETTWAAFEGSLLNGRSTMDSNENAKETGQWCPNLFDFNATYLTQQAWPGLSLLRILQLARYAEEKAIILRGPDVTRLLQHFFRYDQALARAQFQESVKFGLISEVSNTGGVVSTPKGRFISNLPFRDLSIMYFMAHSTPLPARVIAIVPKKHRYHVAQAGRRDFLPAALHVNAVFRRFLRSVESLEQVNFLSACNTSSKSPTIRTISSEKDPYFAFRVPGFWRATLGVMSPDDTAWVTSMRRLLRELDSNHDARDQVTNSFRALLND